MNQKSQAMPKVGIRPVIDARLEGIRESLEDQTMNMAKNVAQLISSTLKYPSGEQVECILETSTDPGTAGRGIFIPGRHPVIRWIGTHYLHIPKRVRQTCCD